MRSSLTSSRGRWAIEGGYVETPEGLIFTVKGLVHPPGRVVAYLRYMRDPSGDRVRGGVKYRRVYGFEEQESIVKTCYPKYSYYDSNWDAELQAVPLSDVVCTYSPDERLKGLFESRVGDKLEELAKGFAEELSSTSGVDLGFMGVSGSLLLSLHHEGSDVDFMVYGRENCIKAQRAMRDLLDEAKSFKRLGEAQLKELYRSRSTETPMSYEFFAKQELRKVIQGVYRGCMYFIRFVKDLNEVEESYGERRTRGLGRAKVRALVTDDLESIFTPCTYGVKCLEVLSGKVDAERLLEVTSFRGRFAEQALRGEEVEVKGRLEEVHFRGRIYQRLVVGSRGDYMVSLSL